MTYFRPDFRKAKISVNTSAEFKKVQERFRNRHRSGGAFMVTLLGGAFMVPFATRAHADEMADGKVLVTDIKGVMDFEVQPDGSVLLMLENGEMMSVAADQVSVGADGAVHVTDVAASEITTAGIAAAGGGVLLANVLGAGGASLGSSMLSKSIKVIDAPLENALVFYDRNGNGNPDESEFLGLTDSSGAVNVSYAPVSGAEFLIISIPSTDALAASAFDWSTSFMETNFYDEDGNRLETRDTVTGNLLDVVLSASDVDTDQVISPISTLLAAGVDEAQLKAMLGVSADTDLLTFDFYESLNSGDEAVKAAAKKVAAAAVVAQQVVSAALTAAQAAKTDGALTTAEIQALAKTAVASAASVISKLPADTPLDMVAKAASAVATASALDSTLDVESLSSSIASAVNAAKSNTTDDDDTIEAALDAAIASSVTTALPDADSTVISTITSISKAAGTSASSVQTVFDTMTSTDDADFQSGLDAATDDGLDAVDDAVNSNLLGVTLVRDVQEAEEGVTMLVKGNVLENDSFSDGTPLGGELGLYSVNGKVLSTAAPEEGAEFLYLSTGAYTPNKYLESESGYEPVGGADVGLALGLTEEEAEEFLPSGRSAGQATEGSALVITDLEVTQAMLNENGGTITLSYDYAFGSLDYIPYNDYSYFAYSVDTDGDGVVDDYAVYRGLTEDAEDEDYVDETGTYDVEALKGQGWYVDAGTLLYSPLYTTYTFEITEAGTYSFATGVTDVSDNYVNSYLIVTDLQLVGSDGVAITEYDDSNLDLLGNGWGYETEDYVNATVATGYYGTLIISRSGDYVYQVGAGDNAEDVPAGVTVTDKFTYTVQLEDGRLATKSLVVKITGNEADVEEGATLSVDDLDVINRYEAYEMEITGTADNVFVSGEEHVVTVTLSSASWAEDLTYEALVKSDGSFTTGDINIRSMGDGVVTATVEYENGMTGADLTATDTFILDTKVAIPTLSLVSVDNDAETVTLSVAGISSEIVSGRIRISDENGEETGETLTIDGSTSETITVSLAGSSLDLTSFLSAEVYVVDTAGNEAYDTVDNIPGPDRSAIVNETTGMIYDFLQEAIDAASEGDTLILAGGQDYGTSDNSGTIYIDKAITIEGANAGVSAKADEETLDPDGGYGERGSESVILSNLVVTSDGVTIDGVQLEGDEPLSWDGLDIDDFSLLNSIMVGYDADGIPTFGSKDYNGAATASGWVIEGNLIGGVTEGIGATMVLSGLADSSISDNTFWRPAGAFLYLSSLTDTEIDGNFFYMGLNSGGLDLDGYAAEYNNRDSYGDTRFGRNFWFDLKGTNSDVSITNNESMYTSGGIQIYGEADGYSFTNIVISGNSFADFINSDPDGVLGENGDYHISGFMGAIVVSVKAPETDGDGNVIEGTGSTASNITITDNTIEAAQDVLYSDQDLYSLIYVQGYIADDLTVTGNSVSWIPSSAQVVLEALEDAGADASEYAGAYVNLVFSGAISGEVLTEGNDFSGASYDIGINADDAGEFGILMPESFVITGQTSFSNAATNIVFFSLPGLEFDPEVYSFDDEDGVYIYLPDNGTTTTSDDFAELVGGDSADFSSPSAGSDVFYARGEDVTMSAEGVGPADVVIENVGDGFGDTVTNFEFGTLASGGDVIALTNVTELNFFGNDAAQFVAANDDVSADAGMVILTYDVAGSGAAVSAYDALDFGSSAGDFMALYADSSSGDVTLTLMHVDSSGVVSAGAEDGTTFTATFEDITETELSAVKEANFADDLQFLNSWSQPEILSSYTDAA